MLPIVGLLETTRGRTSANEAPTFCLHFSTEENPEVTIFRRDEEHSKYDMEEGCRSSMTRILLLPDNVAFFKNSPSGSRSTSVSITRSIVSIPPVGSLLATLAHAKVLVCHPGVPD